MSRSAEPSRVRLAGGLLFLFLYAGCGGPAADDGPQTSASPVSDAGALVLYTSLPHERVLAIADAYREQSGQVVNFMIDSPDVLIDSLAQKNHSPPADVLLIEGTGPVASAVERDVLRPVDLNRPAGPDDRGLADPDGYWFGVGYSVDAIIAASGTDLDGLSYASLASEEFAGRLCLRRGTNERTRTLVAALLARTDARNAELVVRGWRNNLARSAYESDAELVQAVAEGACAVAVAASDAIARYLAATPDATLAFHVPSPEERGPAVHPVAAAVNRHAGQPESAEAFLRWLMGARAQSLLNEGSGRFPVNGESPLPDWPEIPVSVSGPSAAGFVYEDAVRLMERARFL